MAQFTQPSMASEVTSSEDYIKSLRGLDKKQLQDLLLKYQTKDPVAKKSEEYKKWEAGAADNELFKTGAGIVGKVGGAAAGTFLAPGVGTAMGGMLGGGIGDIAGLLSPHEWKRGEMGEMEQGRIDDTIRNQEKNMRIVKAIQSMLNEKNAAQQALQRLASSTGQGPTIT